MLRRKRPEDAASQPFPAALDAASAQPAEKGWKPFWKKHWKKILAVVCAAAIAGGIVLPRFGATPAQANTTYLETAPETRNITNTFSGSGTLAAANTYTVKSLVKGTVLTSDFEVGDVIDKGTVLYTIDSSDVSSSIERAQLSLDQAQRNYDGAVDAQYVRSMVSGTVASLKVAVGDVVNAGQEVAVVREDSTLLLTLEFPAADAAGFAVGQRAEVTLDGTFETLTGTVRSVAGTDTLSSGNLLVRTVVVAVPNTGSLTTAQAATASIHGVSALASARFTYQREQSITASSSGKVTTLCVKEGQTIGENAALLQLSGNDLSKQVQNASDNLRSARMSMEDAEKSMENYTITSPISGTVISKDVKAGDTVGTSSSTSEAMCVIYDLSSLEMTLNVDELEILSIQEGQEVSIEADAVSDRTFTGVVTSVSSAGTTSGGTTTYPVTVRIDDTGDLLPGMNATATITIARAENALSVPNAAIVRGNYVLVTSDSPSAANADPSMKAPDGYVYVKVTTGISDDDYIAVTDGLQEGDTVAYDASTATKSTKDDQQMEFQVVGGPGMGGNGGRPGGGGGAPGGGH